MPLILSTLVRRWLLTAIALPVAAGLMTAAGRRLERSRGPNRLSSALVSMSNLAARGKSTSAGPRRRLRHPVATFRSSR